MDPFNWIAPASLALALIIAIVGVAVRFGVVEQRIGSLEKDASSTDAEISLLRDRTEKEFSTLRSEIAREIAGVQLQARSDAAAHNDTKIEVVRLQEHIKHLSDLIERYFVPNRDPTVGRPRT